MRALKACLWIMGIGCALGTLTLLVPMGMLEKFGGMFGQGSFPQQPLFNYVLRGLMATYAGVGGFYIILALHPERYGVMVPFSGVAAIFVGLVLGIYGGLTGVPKLWFLGDSVFCVTLGTLILLFWGLTRSTPGAPPAGTPRQRPVEPEEPPPAQEGEEEEPTAWPT